MANQREASPTAPAAGPYTGVRVIDFSMFLAGPYCSRLMADMGADVIKIEPPHGDFLRAAPPLRDGHSAYFAHLNCGKRSLSLDLKHAEGVELVHRLFAEADVVLENFRPGVMARLGIGYEQAREHNPGIIYCSVSGYGQIGPNAERASFAPIIQAASGFEMLAPRYEPTLDRPITNRNAMADYLAAAHALAGIGAALYHRATTGQGQHLDVALMDAMHNAMSYEYVDAQFPGQTPPTFRPMPTRDGFVAIAAVSQANFFALVRAAGHPEWAEDPRFASGPERIKHWDLLLDTIASWSNQHSSDEVESALLREGCPASTYRTIGVAQRDEQVRFRQAAVTVSDAHGEIQVANCPIQFSGTGAQAHPHAPGLGQHTEEILSELDCPASEIERLRSTGVLG